MQFRHEYLINGKREPGISPFDRGFAYGDGVFRTLAARRGQLRSWGAHFKRLQTDCNVLGIVCPSEELLLSDIARLIDEESECVIKIIVTRGEGERGYAVPALAQPTRVVIRTPLPQYPEEHYASGVSLFLCQTRLSHQPRLAGIKHLNRLENVLARMEWVDTQVADGLMLDMDGHVIECTMSNLFMRSVDTLITPDLSKCGVAGITRQRIIDFAPQLGYKAAVRPITLSELMDADEVVVCNSLYGVWQVKRLASHAWPFGVLAAKLREQLVKEDDAFFL
jgi:4-amino-4-deoxychorismate lyase